VVTFPVVGKGGPWWRLREDQIAEWRALYPNVDVIAEARKALGWLRANPDRRKTARGMAKFLVNWLNRSVDRSPARGGPVITGSLKTAGNKASLEEFLRRRGHVVE
jgi:hypothetical protein